jgi:hypothetical protein
MNMNMNKVMGKDMEADTDRLLGLKNAGMPDCLASSQPGTGMNKITMLELVRTKLSRRSPPFFWFSIGLN